MGMSTSFMYNKYTLTVTKIFSFSNVLCFGPPTGLTRGVK